MERIKRHIKKTRSIIVTEYRKSPKLFTLRSIAILAISYFIFFVRSFWDPDTLLLVLLFIGLIFGHLNAFARRFVPFMGMLFVYDSMRSIVPMLNHRLNIWPMIQFDRWIGGGQIIASRLQQLLWQGHVVWYDFGFYILYTLHFLMPVVLGLILWRFKSKLYWPFVWTIVSASFIAFFVYLAFPAVPPWMAAEKFHLISEPFRHVSGDVWWAIGLKNYSVLYPKLAGNPVAAVPSLHSAYPMIAALFVTYAFGFKKYWWIWAYPLAMWVGVMYLGEHYLFDIFAAWLDVAAAFGAVWLGYRWYNKRKLLAKARHEVDTDRDNRDPENKT